MNTRIFQPQILRGKGISGRTIFKPITLNNNPITIIVSPLENILFRITLFGSLPFFLLILKITLRAERKTKSDGPTKSNDT